MGVKMIQDLGGDVPLSVVEIAEMASVTISQVAVQCPDGRLHTRVLVHLVDDKGVEFAGVLNAGDAIDAGGVLVDQGKASRVNNSVVEENMGLEHFVDGHAHDRLDSSLKGAIDGQSG